MDQALILPRPLNLIGGVWQPSASGGELAMISPIDGAAFAVIAQSGPADIDAAVTAARAALDGDWGRLTAAERGRLMLRLSRRIDDEAEALAQLETRDNGKPIAQSRADMAALARYFEYYGGAADKLHGEVIPFLNGHDAKSLREPHGVTGHIIPWNYPVQIFGRSVGAALAMGNATVTKPAEDACLSILRIGELATEAGFPPGAINIVTGRGEVAGRALSEHPGVDFISFTGSPEVGQAIQIAAARNHIPCTLELGGKSPQIVFDDADLAAAAPVIVNAIVQNGGQTCSAGSRVLIQRGIWDRLTAMLAERFRAVVAQTPGEGAVLGPLISARQKARVERYIEDAGAPLLARGSVAPDAPPGGVVGVVVGRDQDRIDMVNMIGDGGYEVAVLLVCALPPEPGGIGHRGDKISPGEAGVVNHGTHRTHGRGDAVETAEVVVAVRYGVIAVEGESRLSAECVVRPRDCNAVLNLTDKVKPCILKEM